MDSRHNKGRDYLSLGLFALAFISGIVIGGTAAGVRKLIKLVRR